VQTAPIRPCPMAPPWWPNPPRWADAATAPAATATTAKPPIKTLFLLFMVVFSRRSLSKASTGFHPAARILTDRTAAGRQFRWRSQIKLRQWGVSAAVQFQAPRGYDTRHVVTAKSSGCSAGLMSLTCQGNPCLPSSSRNGLAGNCSTFKTPLPDHAPLNNIMAPTMGGTPVV